MVNYNNEKIYKIVADDGDKGDVYVGSTTKKYLCDRMHYHRKDYKRWKKEGKVSKVSSYELFEKYGVENCYIVLIELVNVNSKDELIARERFYIESIKCVNKRIEGRTKKEYNDANKETHKERNKLYYENHKETLNIKLSKPFSCKCGSVCCYGDKSKHFKTIKHQNFLKQI